METRTKKVTVRKRLRRLRKSVFHYVKLGYAMPTSAEKREQRNTEGLPTWRFDVTVIIAAVTLGVPLLWQ